MDGELGLRIVVLRPVHGVVYRVQRGRDELLEPVRVSADALVFDLAVRVGGSPPDGEPNFPGPYAQGPRGDRFVYVNTGTMAGQAESPWTRRAKVRLSGIGWDLVEQAMATPGAVLRARVEGTGADGGPACAGVPCWKAGGRSRPAAKPHRDGAERGSSCAGGILMRAHALRDPVNRRMPCSRAPSFSPCSS